jgi:hypothetical protein
VQELRALVGELGEAPLLSFDFCSAWVRIPARAWSSFERMVWMWAAGGARRV